MLLGAGYLGDFLGDPFAFTENEVAGVNSSSQVKFYFTDAGLLPSGAKLFAYGNGLILDRDLFANEQHAYTGTANAFASPGIAPGLDDGVYNPLAGLQMAQYEFAIALSTFSKITIRRINWTSNNPRILQAEHAVKKDSAEILTEGTIIVHDDVELGRIFLGKIHDVDKNWKNGEGVVYTCADAYRTFVKEPARHDFKGELLPSNDYGPGLSSLRFDKGVPVNETIRRIIALQEKNVCPGGVSFSSGMPDYAALKKALDKTGQSISQWLDDILEQSEGGICYLDPLTRALKVRDYYQESALTLTEGTYNVVTPSSANPLIVEGNIKSTLNNKYERIVVEGVGKFTRRVDVAVVPVYQNGAGVENPANVWLYILRFYFPHNNVLGFHYDENDEIQSEIHLEATVQIGLGTPFLITSVLSDEDVKRNTDPLSPHLNKCYRDYALVFGNVGQPAVVVTNAKLRYTSYDGPLIVEKVSTDARLKGEGSYLVQRPDLFSFESPGYYTTGMVLLEAYKMGMYAINPTADMQLQADTLAKRHSTRPDSAGRVAVHIKDLTASIVPGSYITNFDARVQSIEFDVVNRDLILDLSDVPIRRELQEQKDAAVMRSETSRQLNVNNRFGGGDVAPMRTIGFNRNVRMVREDCCEECDCPAS